MNEPILSDNDRYAWDTWIRTATVYSRTQAHARQVEKAKRITCECLSRYPDTAVMWSGGKDSTAMTYLVCADQGHRHLAVYSEKDDLDFPGEREYVESLAGSWGIKRFTVLEPSISPTAWLAEHACELSADDDIHGRTAGLSKACFYQVVEEANAQHNAIMLGLRTEESVGRRKNRTVRGPIYRKANGYTVCTPIVDWRGIDVYAYLLSHDVQLLDMYRCVGLMHAEQPWRVRKSWWIPGSHSSHGGIVWLKRYYPSLYRKLYKWIPDARRVA